MQPFPFEARRFQIDQDFLPVHHAPGDGADIIFEFKYGLNGYKR
jgi:hypothetical protein